MKKLMVVLFFMLLLIPNMAGHIWGGEDVNLENRDLASFPRITKENWQEVPKFAEDYINDHAPFRYELLNGYAWFNWNVFQTVDNRNVMRGEDGWLFYKGDGSINDMIGVNIFPEELMEIILQDLLKIRESYTEDPGQFVLFIAPNKELVYRDKLSWAYVPVSDTATVDALVSYIRRHSDLKVVYPLEELEAARRNVQVYYETDTHWNRLGGFVGTQALIEHLGGMKAGLEEVQVVWDTKTYRGDLANQAHIPDKYVKDHEADIQGYLEGAQPKTEEGTFVLKSHRADAPDKRKLVMVRDSFGENMVPWLSKYFQDTTVVHYSYVPEMAHEDMEGDIFVYEIVERYLGRLPGQLEELKGIR